MPRQAPRGQPAAPPRSHLRPNVARRPGRPRELSPSFADEPFEDALEQASKRPPLVSREALQHLVLQALPRLVRALQGAPPGRGHLDEVTPAVARVAAPDRELAGFELVKDQNHA